MRFKKLLVPVDFSEPSRQAFHAGVAMAADTGAPLVLVHVVEVPRVVSDLVVVPPSPGPSIETAKAKLAEWRREAEAAGAHLVTTRVETGVPWHAIVALLRADRSFDLAILGTHGWTGLKHALIGSVAERVVRHAPCPVLVVRSEK